MHHEEQVLALTLDEEVPADLQLQRVPYVEGAQVPLLEPHPDTVAETVVLAGTGRSGHRMHLIDDILRLAAPAEPENQENALPLPLALAAASARIRIPLDDGAAVDPFALENHLEDLVPRHVVVGDADAQPHLRLGRVLVHRGPHGEVLHRLDTVVADDRRHPHADRDLTHVNGHRPARDGLDVLLRLAPARLGIGHRAVAQRDRLGQPAGERDDQMHRVTFAGIPLPVDVVDRPVDPQRSDLHRKVVVDDYDYDAANRRP